MNREEQDAPRSRVFRLRRPRQREKPAPCQASCPSGADIRGWIALIAQRERLGLSENEAFTRAWNKLVEVNPFPATMGRICPHPCEAHCNRNDKDGAVSINALERFIGDWALQRKLPLPRLERDAKPESIGVIGAGPSGLSFAYQMARRGYSVIVYEKFPKPGGMLHYGVPVYRLPEEVLGAEVQRILDVGVELRLGTAIGRDVTVAALRERHDVLFLGIGAHKGRLLGVPGERGAGMWTGTDYLNRINRGETIELGARVAVVGGGNTAIDAARAALRTGAQVTLLYRRTREEMPAIDSEIDDALEEGVNVEYLVAPVGIRRNGAHVQAAVVRRMALGKPDESGRRRPLPIEGSEFELPIDSLIAAISQTPDWNDLAELNPGGGWIKTDGHGRVGEGLWAGGDALDLGIASAAIAHGRHAAEEVHAELRGLAAPAADERSPITSDRIQPDYYQGRPRAELLRRSPAERLGRPWEEISHGIDKEQFLEETSRCYSCGQCFGCQHCWMYCNPAGITRVEQARPGTYFTLLQDRCEGCGKCIEICPCGFLEVQE